MVTSAAYCQDSIVEPQNANHKKAADRGPREQTAVAIANVAGLEGESLRDAMLSLGFGELNPRCTASCRSSETAGETTAANYAWKPDAKVEGSESAFDLRVRQRNMRYPLFDAFDWPDLHKQLPLAAR